MNNKIDVIHHTDRKNNLQVINLLNTTLESDSDSRSIKLNNSGQDNSESVDNVINSDDEILFIGEKPRNNTNVDSSIEQKPFHSQHSTTDELHYVTCPICHRNDICHAIINEHIDNCLALKQN